MKHISILTLMILILASCTNDGKKADQNPTEIRESLMSSFSQLADPQTGLLNKDASKAYIDKAIAFSDQFPSDTLAAFPLYRSAEISRSLGKPNAAIDAYQKVLQRYPTFHKAAEAQFMLAFSYDEDLKDMTRARKSYTEFIAKYPNHTFADDAQMLLSNLGKTDEEILKELEANLEVVEKEK